MGREPGLDKGDVRTTFGPRFVAADDRIGRVTPALPDPALIVLVGAPASGKSVWAHARYRASEIVSSDDLRAVVGSGPHDLDATTDAFALLDQIVAGRLRRRLTTVVDTIGLDPVRRRAQREAAAQAGLPAAAVVLDTPDAVCRERNRTRDWVVPAPALTGFLKRMRSVGDELATEGWDLVVTVRPDDGAATADVGGPHVVKATRTHARASAAGSASSGSR